MARRRLGFLLPVLVLACGPAAPPGEVEPLLDGLHAPLVLTESAALDHPPSYSGNRFLTGWRRWRRPEGVWQINEGELSSLEMAHIQARPRRLRLPLEIGEAAPGATVGVRAAGRALTPPALVPELEIALPPDLPLGRVPIELDFGGARLAVEAATLDGVRRPGSVRFEDGAIVQSGYSIVDFPRRLDAATTLIGRFEPPGDARPEQRFALVVETEETGEATVFEWRPGRLAGLLGGRDLRVPLPPGIVRLRLLAQGAGRPGRWQGLGLAAETAAPTPPPPAPPGAPRLIVLYVMDALRADAVGHLGGDPAASPVIDRLAAEGVSFERYYSVSPDTVGSTKALLSGVPVLTPGGRGVKLAAGELDTLGVLFSRAGFRTGLFTGQPNVTSYGAADGFEEERYSWLDNDGEVNRNAERVQADFLDWLGDLGAGERAFAMLQTIHPHNPYMPPEPFHGRFTAGIDSTIDGSTKTLLDVHHGRRQTTAADRRRLAALYHANLAYNDHQLGLLLEELARRYAPGEVLLLVTSDHGDELFEHGGVLHGFTLYEEQLRIPLVVWWPEQLAPRRVRRLADNLDLNTTLRALAGAAPARGGGVSLWPAIVAGDERDEDGTHMAAAAGLKGGLFMAASERYKLIMAPRGGMGIGRGRTGEPEYVFDLAEDPGEQRNLAGSRALEVAWLRARLMAWIERGRLDEAGGEPAELDEATRERLRALGYLD